MTLSTFEIKSYILRRVNGLIELKYLDDDEFKDYKWRFDIWFKAAIGFSIFTIVVYIVASTASAIYAPDINLIQDVIFKMKGN